MAVISNADFELIAGYYGNAYKQLQSVQSYLYSAVTDIANINTVEPTLDLITQFYNTYTITGSTISSNLPLLGAVRQLNTHVMNRGGYTSIGATGDATSFLTHNDLTVPSSWATLSAAAGQTIDPSHIVG